MSGGEHPSPGMSVQVTGKSRAPGNLHSAHTTHHARDADKDSHLFRRWVLLLLDLLQLLWIDQPLYLGELSRLFCLAHSIFRLKVGNYEENPRVTMNGGR